MEGLFRKIDELAKHTKHAWAKVRAAITDDHELRALNRLLRDNPTKTNKELERRLAEKHVTLDEFSTASMDPDFGDVCYPEWENCSDDVVQDMMRGTRKEAGYED